MILKTISEAFFRRQNVLKKFQLIRTYILCLEKRLYGSFRLAVIYRRDFVKHCSRSEKKGSAVVEKFCGLQNISTPLFFQVVTV